MGLCFPCPGESAPPWSDLKEKRAKFAEAAERRQEEAACWDILDIQAKEVEKEKEKNIENKLLHLGPYQKVNMGGQFHKHNMSGKVYC
uniref:Uncharacterized protein n=1 Tax=Panthera leo TaxID=9689 RepID=A0A8C9D8X8_PANLE